MVIESSACDRGDRFDDHGSARSRSSNRRFHRIVVWIQTIYVLRCVSKQSTSENVDCVRRKNYFASQHVKKCL